MSDGFHQKPIVAKPQKYPVQGELRVHQIAAGGVSNSYPIAWPELNIYGLSHSLRTTLCAH
jgi:hypothetical protein